MRIRIRPPYNIKQNRNSTEELEELKESMRKTFRSNLQRLWNDFMEARDRFYIELNEYKKNHGLLEETNHEGNPKTEESKK
jgi:hypothetical protein